MLAVLERMLPLIGIVLFASSAVYARSGARNEDHGVSTYTCSSGDTACWNEGSLPHTNGSCYPPLQQGPCREGQWFLLDATSPNFRGKCGTLGCPPNRRPGSECRRLMETVARLCPALASGAAQHSVHMDPAGLFRCGESPGRVRSLHALVRCQSDAGSSK